MSRFIEPTEEEAKNFMQQDVAASPRFKEPTEQEASQFAQKQTEEIPSDQKKLSASDLAEFLGQGLTYGGMEEILGALKASKEVALGKPELKDWYDIYQKEREKERQRLEALSTESPYATGAAELYGSFISPVNKLLMPAKALGEGATLLQKLAQGAETGAKIGALSGIGSSEAGLEKPTELLKSIGESAASGGVFGAGLTGLGELAGKAIPAAAEKLKESSPLGRNLITAFQKSMEGKGFISEQSEKRIEQEARDVSKRFGEMMYAEEGPLAKTSKDIGKFFTMADDAGTTVAPDYNILDNIVGAVEDLERNQLIKFKDVPKVVKGESTFGERMKKSLGRTSDITSSMSSSEVKIFLDNIDRLMTGQMNSSEAYNFGRWLEGADVPGLASLKGSRFTEIVQKLPQLAKGIKETAISSAEERLGVSIKPLLQKFRDVRAGTVETILNKARPEELSDVWQSDFAKSEIKKLLFDDFKKILEKLSDPSTTGTESRTIVSKLEQRINGLNEKYPDLNLKVKDLIEDIKDVSAQKNIRAKLVTSHNTSASPAADLVTRLSDLVGYGGAGVVAGNVARIPVAFNNFIVKASDQTLIPLAQKLKQTPGLQHIGQALEDGVVNKSGKNAALFMIMQNPEARAIAKEHMGAE